MSTAPISVGGLQDSNSESSNGSLSQEEGINEIAEFLMVTEEDKDKEKELVIMIHGYNTTEEKVEKEYKGSFKYIQEKLIQPLKNKKLFFIGYRWPSENIGDRTSQRFEEAVEAFPLIKPIMTFIRARSLWRFSVVLSYLIPWLVIWYLDFRFSRTEQLIDIPPAIYWIMWIIGGFSAFYLLFQKYSIFILLTFFDLLISVSFLIRVNYNIQSILGGWVIPIIIAFYIILFLLVVIIGSFLTFILLRITCYFRDQYRANYFAVSDLVDLIKQLDSKIIEKSLDGYWDVPEGYWHQETQKQVKRIKLSFIAHSMGAFIATETIRTLADIFDDNLSSNPSSFIGKTFSLGRLILVSPDISIGTILPGRSNFLATSLTRCDEVYLFSSQGDTVLRALSTIANYFSFPACTEQRGFRLGNLVINETHKPSHKDPDNKRDVIEILNTTKRELDDQQFINSLCIVCDKEEISVYNEKLEPDPSEYKVAKLFTYFDCTYYKENKEDTNGYLTEAKRIRRLGVSHHFRLLRHYFEKENDYNHHIDIHGGYFQGDFSKKMIYGLACLGFVDFLKLIDPSGNKIREKCQTFSNECKKKGIQGLLSEKNRQKL